VAANTARAQVCARPARGDVARYSGAVGLFERIDAELGQPTAMINDAGAASPVGRVEALPGRPWEWHSSST
jgi:NAD(P)-dependent dehydrogenase (short-subunit alcohol dehydrogenase family)